MQLILVTNVDLGENKYEKYIYIGFFLLMLLVVINAIGTYSICGY